MTTDWQPIETAPKDGTEFIGAIWHLDTVDCSGKEAVNHWKWLVTALVWHKDFSLFAPPYHEVPGRFIGQPSLWSPLPQPPAQTGKT